MIRQTSCIIARTSDPCRNLAIEKHLMDTLPEGTAILFLYRSENAVTVGRNQNPWYECDVEPFLESGGIITRRLTGGGTFYQDAGTLNFSVILPKTELNAPRQLALAASAAQLLGLPVQPGPCASLMTDGRIFCQNAFFKAGSTALHNGCILINPDMEQMARTLLPGGKRYRGQQRPPVESLYTGVCDQLPTLTLDAMEEALYRAFTAQYNCQPVWLDEQMLTESNLQRTAESFANPEWVYPEALPYNFVVDERFPWGSITVMLQQENGIISASRIFSDAMEAALFDRIQQALTGCPYLIGAIGTRFEQRLGLIKDPRLLQIAGDVCKLICGRIRAMDRQGEGA
ncbi:MAG: hypothetical protein IKC28_06845 [Clostridia bacterium]|nr:hypothetical protein [Clostridia bacterium]